MVMQIFLNGETKELTRELSLAELIAFFELPDKRIAVELNREVIRRADWHTTTVAANDNVEVIHFVGGG
jgi:thiamine biosynthesis protein ThiS